MAALGATGLGIVAKFFPGAVPAEGAGKTAQSVAIGATSLLAFGGIASSLMSSNPIGTPKSKKDDDDDEQEGGGMAGLAFQNGGGKGTSLPPLSSFANQVGGRRTKSTGKSSTDDDAKGTTFLGILGMVIVGGLTLSYLRKLDA